MIVLQAAAAGGHDQRGPEQDKQRAKAAFRAAYNFLDQYSGREMTADDWMRAADDMTRIYSQGNEDPFLGALLMAVYEELGRRANNQGETIAEAG